MAGPSRSYRLYRLAWRIIDVVFPPLCVGCGKPGTRWCPDCLSKISLIHSQVCPRCGLPQIGTHLCHLCQAEPPKFTGLRSWASYGGPVQKAIQRLKYHRDMALGDSLAAYMLPALERTGWQADMVLPVPLSRPRRRERGYNQAGLIARPLALALGLPYVPKALARCRDTRSQVGLSREQRRQNVNGVFQAGSEQVRDRRVLLIDDVATTGSTLSAAAGALLASGASQIYAFTAARAAWTASVTHPGAP